MIRLTIDGREVTVPEGTMIVDAAAQLGIEVPIYCYHQALGPLGACRMCLVQVEKMPKLVTGCTTAVQEGMVVHTKGPAVTKGQKGVLEFLLINHPLDCPVCDKGGECFLQDYTFKYGAPAGRYDEPKIHKLKDGPVNEFIIIDQERCVLCQRCVRFLGDYVGEEQLLLDGRGVDTVVSTVGHQPVSSPFSGNVIDLCPVGALLSIPYRYKARPWNLEREESVCPHCPVGCTTSVTSREGRVIRVEGRPIPGRNWGWLCDRGRFGYDFGYDAERLLEARIDGAPKHAAEATRLVGSWLRETVEEQGGDRIAFLVGGSHTVEEAYQIQRFAREVAQSSRVATLRSVRGYLPSGLNGSFEDVKRADTIVYLGVDPYDAVPVVHLKIRDRLRGYPDLRIIGIGPRILTRDTAPGEDFVTQPDAVGAIVAKALEAAAGDHPAVKALASELGDFVPEVAGTPPAEVAARLRKLGEALLDSEHLTLLWDGQDPGVEAVLLALREVRENATAVLPTWFPSNWRGYERAGVSARFEDLTAILEAAAAGKIDILYLFGGDLVREYPDRDLAIRALKGAKRVVYEGLFLPEGAEAIDVVVPGAGWGEVYGTYVNMEGRLQVAMATVQPPGQARPVRTYLASWSHALKKPFDLEEDWDPYDDDSGDFIPREPLPEVTALKPPHGAAEGFWLVAEQIVIEGGLPSEILAPRRLQNPGRIAPEDAARLRIESGTAIEVEGSRGRIRVRVESDPRVPSGRLVLPMGVPESPVNAVGDGPVRVARLEEVSAG